MIRKSGILLILSILGLFLAYCTKDKDNPVGATNQVIISTSDIQGLSSDSCWSGGSIQSDGGDSVTERGVCWATVDSPLITIHDRTNDGRGVGTYKSLMKPMKPSTTYYARAYLKNAQGTIYGRVVTFKTPSRVPTVLTDPAAAITHISANVGGNVTSDGGATIIQRGIYWSETNTQPNKNDSTLVIGTGTGPFSGSLTRLKGNRTYYIRAWASNSVGLAIATNVINFTTQAPKLPVLGTVTASNITWSTASASSSVISNEGSDISQYGFCWSKFPNPTVSVPDKNIISSNILGNFSTNLNALSAGATYYLRAFALNDAGYGYSSNSVSFTTLGLTIPKVSLSQAMEMGTNKGYAAGIVSEDGGATVTSRGFLISTTSPPPINGTSMLATGTGIGAFNADLFPLSAGTTYFVRAFAVNSIGMALSPEIRSFQTRPPDLPVVTTNFGMLSGLSATSVSLGGSVLSDGNGIVTDRGICYGLNTAPTISGSRVVMGSGLGTFSGTVTGLTPDRTYYYRAYAINASGPAYGGQAAFLTPMATPVLTTPNSGVVIGCCTRTFSWSQVNGADRYEIQFSRSSLFTSAALNITNCSGGASLVAGFTNWAYANTTAFCLSTGGSGNNGLWYWRVRALNSNNASVWSQPNTFNYSW
jgi:hypothetical protein